jgi:hypothetical protein
MMNDQRSSLLCLKALRLTAHLALVAAYSRGKRSEKNREHASDTGENHVWFEDRWMVASLCDE